MMLNAAPLPVEDDVTAALGAPAALDTKLAEPLAPD